MIAVEDEVFTHTQIDEENKFGTFDGAKTAALKTKRQRKRTNSRSHSSDGNEDDPTSPMESEFPKVRIFNFMMFHSLALDNLIDVLRPHSFYFLTLTLSVEAGCILQA